MVSTAPAWILSSYFIQMWDFLFVFKVSQPVLKQVNFNSLSYNFQTMFYIHV